MLLAGLWFGKGKFDPNLMLKPIWEELEVLKKGISFIVPSLPSPVNFKCALLCGTCDTPAKSMFFWHIAFNGHYGCLKCLSKGEKSQRTGNVFVYPFQENLELRTDENHREHVRGARDNIKRLKRRNAGYFGVKGPTFLSNMLLVSLIRSTSIDLMHNIFLGNMKYLLKLWFGKKHKDEAFSLFQYEKLVSEYLCSAKPPHFLQRVPQSIAKLAFWKASEFQSFFFYYSLPVLRKVMDQVLFNHFQLLYLGVTLLCKESVTLADIELSQALLDEFVRKFETHYGLRYMTFNLHCIRHLPSVVKELGPLFTSTCYMFEDLNGILKKLVHGTQFAALQVNCNFELVTRLAVIISELTEGNVKRLCKKMSSRYERLNLTENIGVNVDVVGPVVKHLELDEIFHTCIQNIQGNVCFFERLKVHNLLYIAKMDSFGIKDPYVIYTNNGFSYHGRVQIFVRVSECNCSCVCSCAAKYFAVVQKFDCTSVFKTLRPYAVILSTVSFKESNTIDLVLTI